MTLDTNIIITLLKNEASLVKWFQQLQRDQVIFISSITRAELLSESKSTARQLARIARFLNSFHSVPLDDKIADHVASLRRAYSKLHVPDAAVAATAIIMGTPLASRDKVFRKIKELDLIVP
ncbi:PIN domain-containing protein [Candidatus Berkelbacteria bacterium]|nr:PIN domain-containing protein [Candidatus Berkelbacteria bacterium]